MQKTDIPWADYVWNPVTGCTKASEGCRHCYAEGIARRFWGERKFSDVQCHEDRLDEPLHVRKPGRVFTVSMGDLFHPDVPFEFIDKVGMTVTRSYKKDITFIILTKRPDRMLKYFTDYKCFADNVWLGVSVENQQAADTRIPLLLQTKTTGKRFVSIEPILSPVNLRDIRYDKYTEVNVLEGVGTTTRPGIMTQALPNMTTNSLDWVIVGCESGPGRRPCNHDWLRSIRDQCQMAGVPFYLKQMEVDGKLVEKPELDGRQWLEFPEVTP